MVPGSEKSKWPSQSRAHDQCSVNLTRHPSSGKGPFPSFTRWAISMLLPPPSCGNVACMPLLLVPLAPILGQRPWRARAPRRRWRRSLHQGPHGCPSPNTRWEAPHVVHKRAACWAAADNRDSPCCANPHRTVTDLLRQITWTASRICRMTSVGLYWQLLNSLCDLLSNSPSS